MLSAGQNIRQKNDKLIKIDIKRIYSAVSNPKQSLNDLIEQLRTLIFIDIKAYRQQKTRLPYVVPSLFNPPYRRKENFGSAEYLILDFDHLSEYEINAEEIKEKLKQDSRVLLMFVSPSMNGLKVFFRMNEKIYDAAKYTVFYKNFATRFADSYRLGQVLDSVTSDVTRACFLSVDRNAYFNENAENVIIKDFVDFDNIFTIKEAHKEVINADIEIKKIEQNNDIDDDVFREIKMKLNPNVQKKVESKKNVYVPKELENIMDILKKFIEGYNLIIKELRSINYGKKIIVQYGEHIAEVNLFYGKRGFSVVRSPKTGTNHELMELLYSIVVEFVNSMLN